MVNKNANIVMEIREVKQKIQELISQATDKNERQKQHLSFLFNKLEEVRELETLEKLRGYENGRYLKAFLFYQSIKRANYQPEHLKLTDFRESEKLLGAISRDIEEFEKGSQEEKKPPILTDRQLLTFLAERLAAGKICLKKDDHYLFEVGKVGQPIPFKVFLDDGRVEPDPAKEFLKKHIVSSDSTKTTQKN